MIFRTNDKKIEKNIKSRKKWDGFANKYTNTSNQEKNKILNKSTK